MLPATRMTLAGGIWSRQPTRDPTVLKGLSWKDIDPRGNATKSTYSQYNGMALTTTSSDKRYHNSQLQTD